MLYRCVSDPLVHHGRHFGRTVHALCNVNALITNGILRLGELADEPEEAFTSEYAPLNPYDITWIFLFWIGSGENTKFSKPFWIWFLGSKNGLWLARRRKPEWSVTWCMNLLPPPWPVFYYYNNRYRKVSHAQDPTTRKASRVPLSTGSPHLAKAFLLRSLVMSNVTEASTMRAQEHSYALQGSIGLMRS